MKTIFLFLAVFIPVAVIFFLHREAKRKDIKEWQHYALLTVLAIYCSILFLGISGNLASFGYGDAKVEFVTQKAEEVKNSIIEIQKLTKTTAELSVMNVQLTTLPADEEDEIERLTVAKQKIIDSLKNAGYGEIEIENTVQPITKMIENEENWRTKKAKQQP